MYFHGNLQMLARPQRTLKQPVSYAGIGIHTGKEVSMRFVPAPPGTGIVFQRLDLPNKPLVPAFVSYVQDTSRSTTIGVHECMVQTVEHVLAALYAYQIDNVCIQLTDREPPIADGSAKVFVEMIEEGGIEEQEASSVCYVLKQPVYLSQGQTTLVALPYEQFRISYTLHYPQAPLIRSQYCSLDITPEIFKEEIACCRTFALYEEIALLTQSGLIKGGSLDNAIVIKEDSIFSKEGLRFSDEMVRHKILDLLGDLALIGTPIRAHIIAIRTGHAANVAFGKALYTSLQVEHAHAMV